MAAAVSQHVFRIVVWTLCGLATVFLISRLHVRMSKKGRLQRSDYFLIAALLCLFAGAALLHAILDTTYAQVSSTMSEEDTGTAARITAAIEILWISIYSVKASFLAQFKLHKPPFAYVSTRLTRLYWSAVALCSVCLIFTLAVPIMLCHTTSQCRYLARHNTRLWETSLAVIDIVTDLSVAAISLSLIWMANFPLLYATINAAFKSLPIFATTFATIRLSSLYTDETEYVNYAQLLFWLAVQAAATVILASISVYRIVVLDSLTKDGGQALQLADLTQDEHRLVDAHGSAVAITARLPN